MNRHVPSEYQQIRQLLATLHPDPEARQRMVPADKQQTTLKRLRSELQSEQFFMVVDLLTLSIVTAGGWREMGYDDNSLTFRQYMDMVPNRGTYQTMVLMAGQTFRMANQQLVRFASPAFIATVPLRHASGRVLLVKRTITPWQYSADGYILAYLSEFTIIKDYEGEPMSPRFRGLPPEIEQTFLQAISTAFATIGAAQNPFQPKEMEILRLYANHPAHEPALTIQAVSQLTGNTKETVKSYQKAIVAKARELYEDQVTLDTTRDVALFLKRSGLLLIRS